MSDSKKLMLNGQRVVVTGSGGFVGSHLVRRLVALGAKVLALDLVPGRLTNMPHYSNCTIKNCDLAQADEAVGMISEFAPRFLFHLACHPDGREQFLQVRCSIERNIALTVHALEGFHRGGHGELFIYGDSTKVYGDCDVPYRATLPSKPLSSYAIGKVASWEYCRFYQRLHGIASASVRPTMIYGPDQGMNLFHFVIQNVLSGKSELNLDGGSQTRDPLFIEDAIDGYIAIAEAGRELDGRVINMGGGCETSVRDLAETTVRLMGRNVRVITGAQRPTEMGRSWCDNFEARHLLSWQPKTDIESGLQQTLLSYGVSPCVSSLVEEESKVIHP